MNRTHWSVVPALLAAAWLTLAGATIVSLSDLPVSGPQQTSASAADRAHQSELPAIVVVASR